MLEELKEKVCKANLDLVKHGLVIFTWGNVSGIDRQKGQIVIKPSGINYEKMKPSDMVVVDMNGVVIEGQLRPSSDLPTHLELYKAFRSVEGITHTHSSYATAWAQAGRSIPFFGTTHADYFAGDIPCTRALTKEEIEKNYEKNTGLVIVERFRDIDPSAVPAVLVMNHGTFSFGTSADDAVHNAVVCEQVAKMAFLTEQINPNVRRADQFLLEKHYNRKHGANAYYGQKGDK